MMKIKFKPPVGMGAREVHMIVRRADFSHLVNPHPLELRKPVEDGNRYVQVSAYMLAKKGKHRFDLFAVSD
ncbi:MAG: hypothetical protein DMG08_15395 [Acidobacteria bacterium]|nr:MAG: hypothetical protein DMG08_15395 [Acidobacteriota bacterium]PYV05426.1 MAG: hypothetical protein DMG10_05050 [Acidobacteriota bacterium]